MRARSAARLIFASRRKRGAVFNPVNVLFELEGSAADLKAIIGSCSDAREEDYTYDDGSVTVCDCDHVILHFFQADHVWSR